MMHFADVPVYLHREFVDFRKQINGLSLIVQNCMNESVFEPGLFVFCNKKRDKLKVLYWDKTGFCLWHKRLEKDRFIWPRKCELKVIHWNHEQLNWLLRGFDVSQFKSHNELKYKAI
ncbi:MAG: IS66 family insertion sequence element accessory protein TnpB [Xanthomonadales bacterium]|jgi:transposase|nr:IS66 family insertion sequence element accessory protein TnpB [Xanthomonadales bacterium]